MNEKQKKERSAILRCGVEEERKVDENYDTSGKSLCVCRKVRRLRVEVSLRAKEMEVE